MKLRTLNDVFFALVECNSDRLMLTREAGRWQTISARQLRSWVYATARQLQAWGVGKGDRVVILSENRPEWAVADFACLLLGAADVPIYPTQTAEQCLFVLQDSGARVAFLSTRQQYEKIVSLRQHTGIEHLVLMQDAPEITDAVPMQSFLRHAPQEDDPALDTTGHSIQPDDLATVIYTSGTTGTPKGVMLTQGNIASNLNVSLDKYELGKEDLYISFLPLSHITARHVDYAMLNQGVPLAYCPVIEELPTIMKEVHPTVVVAVPRVYEKIYNQVQNQAHGIKRILIHWALSVGAANRETILRGQTPTSFSWKLANALVFSKVRQGMGGRARIFVSGGAPLGKELATWFADIGIRIHEGYGLTETSPVIAVNNPVDHRLGTVGKPVSNIEVRIAADGELLVRGPSIFKGYWKLPEETAAVLEDGWFKTGDIANLDQDGYLSITDRKRDLIKTSGGKFIAPQPIESTLVANRYVGHAVLLGDRRHFPAVLIIPAFDDLAAWAQQQGLKFSTREELVNFPQVQELYQGIVDQVNENLAKFEKPKKVLLIADEPSIAEGTLTPSMKLRRRHLTERYKKEIDALYADAETHPPTAATAKR
jgi:long-chain acyl-CoA synthetase